MNNNMPRRRVCQSQRYQSSAQMDESRGHPLPDLASAPYGLKKSDRILRSGLTLNQIGAGYVEVSMPIVLSGGAFGSR